MCEQCEWENTVDVTSLIDKWQDALECAEEWTERNLITEFLEDLRG